MVLDHDDLLDSRALEVLVESSLASRAPVIFGMSTDISEDQEFPWRSEGWIGAEHILVSYMTLFEDSSHMGGALVRTRELAVPPFDSEVVPADDYLFLLTILRRFGPGVRIPFVVLGWRRHPGQTSSVMAAKDIGHKKLSAQRAFLSQGNLSKSEQRRLAAIHSYQTAWMAHHYRKDPLGVLFHLAKALARDPSLAKRLVGRALLS